MHLPVRKKLPHTIPEWVATGSRFFITINCVPPGKNQLCRAETGDVVLSGVKFNREKFVSDCCVCLLMPDHLHAAMPSRASRNGNGRQELEEVHRRKASLGWQRDFFDHRSRDYHELQEKTSYVLMTRFARNCASEQRIRCVFIVRMSGRRRTGMAFVCVLRFRLRTTGGQRTAHLPMRA